MQQTYTPVDQTPYGVAYTMFDANGRPIVLGHAEQTHFNLRYSTGLEKAEEFRTYVITGETAPAFALGNVYNRSGEQISREFFQNGVAVAAYTGRVPGIVRHLTQ